MILHQRERRIAIAAAGLIAIACGVLSTPTQETGMLESATINPSPTFPTTIPTATSTPSPSPEPTFTPTEEPVRISSEPADVSYRLPLVVQHVTQTAAMLFLELDRPTELSLLYWPADHPEQTLSMPLHSDTLRHQITLANLNPGMQYEAAAGVIDDSNAMHLPAYGGESWGEVGFRTQGNDEMIRVAVIGDSGFGESVTYQLAQTMLAYDPAFIVHTGDVVYQIDQNSDPYEAFQQKWYFPFSPLLHEMPIYSVVGNHDVEAAAQWEGQSFYYAAFPSFSDPLIGASEFEGRNQWYAFAYGNIQFVMLDTQVFFNEPGRVEQDAWLDERLADQRFAHTIVAYHVTAYSSGNHIYDGLAIQQDWLPKFAAAHVPLVLSGHDHNYERLQVGDLTYIVSGGGSSVLYDQTLTLPESILFARRTHFVLLEIYPDRIELRAVTPDGEVIDQTAIPLN